MKIAKKGDTVRVHYVGKTKDGEVFDSSKGREPLEFRIGDKKMIPGFEAALVGMSEGSTKSVTLPSSEAYGPHDRTLISKVEKSLLPADLPISVGTRLQIGDENDIPAIVTITDITESTITLDANHPLAGEDLAFDIELVDLQEPAV